MPPLRERAEDIPLLVRHFAQQFSRRMKKTIETIPVRHDGRARTRYDWPGNIRELQNLIERAVILSAGSTLNVPIGELAARTIDRGSSASEAAPRGAVRAVGSSAGVTLEEAERRHITSALEAARWVVGGDQGAAARLGMKRSTLQFRMRKLGITRPVR